MSNKTFTEKLVGWMEPHPKNCSALDIAAAAIAIKTQINKENWGTEFDEPKDTALMSIDFLCSTLYHLHDLRYGGNEKQLRMEFEFRSRHSLLDSSYTPPSFELEQKLKDIKSNAEIDFLKQAKKQSKGIDPSIKEVKRMVEGFINYNIADALFYEDAVDVIRLTLWEISDALLAVNHGSIKDRLRADFLPKDGPKSAQDLLLCCFAYLEVCEAVKKTYSLTGSFMPEGEESKDAAKQIISILDEMQNDLPAEKRKSFYKDILHASAKEAMKTHYMKAPAFNGLIHYYLDHNASKMSVSNYAKLKTAHLMFFASVHKEQINIRRPLFEMNGYNVDDVFNDAKDRIDEAYTMYFQNYKKPDIKRILEELRTENRSYKGQKLFEKLNDVIENVPTGMVANVILHCKENPFITKVRQSEFKAKWTPDGEDGPKRAFIKDLAVNHADDLVEVGFSEDDILAMCETGKLPENCGWNVEHIIDREHGGTNHASNFILMPEKLNTLKDTLKQLQKALIPNADEGCFIVTFMPEMLSDGSYPKVFKGHLNDGFNIQPKLPIDENIFTLH